VLFELESALRQCLGASSAWVKHHTCFLDVSLRPALSALLENTVPVMWQKAIELSKNYHPSTHRTLKSFTSCIQTLFLMLQEKTPSKGQTERGNSPCCVDLFGSASCEI